MDPMLGAIALGGYAWLDHRRRNKFDQWKMEQAQKRENARKQEMVFHEKFARRWMYGCMPPFDLEPWDDIDEGYEERYG